MNPIRFLLTAVFLLLSTSTNATLIFSEYVEGSGYNKALEIFNSGSAIDFSSDGYAIGIYANGANTASYTFNLTGVLPQNTVYVIGNSRANESILSVADQLSGSLNFNGDDAIMLMHNGEIVDRIGQIGFDPGAEWGTDETSTQDNTLRRRADTVIGDADAYNNFDPAQQWIGFAPDSFDGLGFHNIDPLPAGDVQSASVPAPGSLLLVLIGMLGVLLTGRPIAVLQKFNLKQLSGVPIIL
ncbi:MAG: lamin tail domain-containing protein [Gammaproteobacteria bacterium]|nr:lamin tail domain-containing protein [Gammaproteobacteria bacterium]